MSWLGEDGRRVLTAALEFQGRPTLGDGQARALLDAPGVETLKVRDIHAGRGVLHLRVHGKGGKVRYLPLHPGTAELLVKGRGEIVP